MQFEYDAVQFHSCNSVNLVIPKLYKSLKLTAILRWKLSSSDNSQELCCVFKKNLLYLSKLTNSLLVTWRLWFLSVINNNVDSVTITMATEHKCMESLKGNAYILYIHTLVIYIDSFISLDFFSKYIAPDSSLLMAAGLRIAKSILIVNQSTSLKKSWMMRPRPRNLMQIYLLVF